MKSEIQFPQFRKYLNGKNYFRIDSFKSFEEIRSLGGKWIIENHEVRILPDHNLVNDLLHNFQSFAVEIDCEDYEMVRKLAG